MKTGHETPPFQVNAKVGFLKRITKFVTLFASACLVISTILFLVFQQKCWTVDSIAGTFIWYSIFLGLYAALFCFSAIIIEAIYFKHNRQATWPFIKKEVAWLVLLIALILLFSLATYLLGPRHQTI
jgi:hypothetical protein